MAGSSLRCRLFYISILKAFFMSKPLLFISMAIMVIAISCSQKAPGDLVFVKGGAFMNTRSNYYGKNITIPDFYIGRYEVTQKEWIAVMGSNPSGFKGNNLPVETVSWYDCVDYCNKRSIKEGLQPFYNIDKTKKDTSNTNALDSIKWTVTIDAQANGYRLPTEAEWEYAASGGQLSNGYPYSGSNNVDDVAWYWKNAGDKYLTGSWSWPVLVKNNNRTKPVGSKEPNELGLYDMSGNVREWCWDKNEPNDTATPQGRIWKGGGWIGDGFCCGLSFRTGYEANGKGPDQGFRVCRGGK